MVTTTMTLLVAELLFVMSARERMQHMDSHRSVGVSGRERAREGGIEVSEAVVRVSEEQLGVQ